MSEREPLALHEIATMGSAPPLQRVLIEPGCLRVDGVVLRAGPSSAPTVGATESLSAGVPPEDEPPPVVRTLADLEALVASREPSNDAAALGVGVQAHLFTAGSDGPLFDPAASDLPPEKASASGLHLDPSRAPIIDRDAFRRTIADDCADRLLSLARDREERPLAERAEGERRMLCQIDALACIGGAGFARLLDWHQQRLASASAGSAPATWATVLSLACLDGREPLEALVQLMVALPSALHATHAARAFATSPNPHAVPLARALIAAGSPIGRVAAVEILSLRQRIGVGDLLDWLEGGEPLIQAAALRGLTRAPELRTSPPLALRLLGSSDPAVAWEAARAVTLWGSHAAHAELRRGGALTETLGAHAAEIYVMTGEEDDLGRLQRIVSRNDMTAELLGAIARFGHPTTWEFLGHHLTDPLLAADAREALRTLFGAALPAEAEADRFGWRDAIAAMRLSPELRYRRGRPWSPATVAAEWRDGALSARAIACRLDELRARAAVGAPVPLHAWRPLPESGLASIATAADQAARRFRAGSWTFR